MFFIIPLLEALSRVFSDFFWVKTQGIPFVVDLTAMVLEYHSLYGGIIVEVLFHGLCASHRWWLV